MQARAVDIQSESILTAAKPTLLESDVPSAFAWGIPIASVLLLLLSPLLGYERWEVFMREEAGFYEIATILILLPAIWLGVASFRRRKHLPKGVGILMLLGSIAALYFAGEEASWGQHALGFETPEPVKQVNAQKEFNLHNLKGGWIFNNALRQAMFAGCLVFGVIIPAVMRKKFARRGNDVIRDHRYWIIPTGVLMPAALLAFLSGFPADLIEATVGDVEVTSYLNMALVEPAGEFKEFCFATVILIYLWSVARRSRRVAADAP